MSRLRRFTAATAAGALAATGALTGTAAAQEDRSCPSSVDTVGEGYICGQLLLNTPTTSPTPEQIGLWEQVLAERGQQGVAEGIVFSDASLEAKVRALYERAFDREPSAEALAHWTGVIEEHGSELPFEYAVFDSGEYLSQFESVEAFVNDQYQYYLGREATIEERQYWAERFSPEGFSNEEITRAIATSQEAGAVRAARLYEDWVRREADPAGFQYWTEVADDQGLYPSIVDISGTPEVFNALGEWGTSLADG